MITKIWIWGLLILAITSCRLVIMSESLGLQDKTITIRAMAKEAVDGTKVAILAHCPENEECQNILRGKKGGEFYFPDASLIGTSIDKSQKEGRKTGMLIGIGAFAAATALAIFSVSKSKALLDKIADHKAVSKRFKYIQDTRSRMEYRAKDLADEEDQLRLLNEEIEEAKYFNNDNIQELVNNRNALEKEIDSIKSRRTDDAMELIALRKELNQLLLVTDKNQKVWVDGDKESALALIRSAMKDEDLSRANKIANEALKASQEMYHKRDLLRIYAGIAVGLTGTAALAFATDLAHISAKHNWEKKRGTIFALFVEGKPVKITEKELRSLVKILNKHLNAEVEKDFYKSAFSE